MTPETFAVAALAAGLVYLTVLGWPHSALRSVLKTLPVALLALGGLTLGAQPLLVAGLGLSALGDFFLSRPGRRTFPAGLAAFLLAHLAYVPAMGGPLAGGATGPVASAAIAVLGLSAEVWLIPRAGRLRWPVRAYVLAIVLMTVSAFGPGGMVALGAVLFMASDFVLALREFVVVADRRRTVALSWAVWLTYLPGQVLIFLGLAGG